MEILEPEQELESAIDFAQAILTTDTVMKNTTYALLLMARKYYFRYCKRFWHD